MAPAAPEFLAVSLPVPVRLRAGVPAPVPAARCGRTLAFGVRRCRRSLVVGGGICSTGAPALSLSTGTGGDRRTRGCAGAQRTSHSVWPRAERGLRTQPLAPAVRRDGTAAGDGQWRHSGGRDARALARRRRAGSQGRGGCARGADRGVGRPGSRARRGRGDVAGTASGRTGPLRPGQQPGTGAGGYPPCPGQPVRRRRLGRGGLDGIRGEFARPGSTGGGEQLVGRSAGGRGGTGRDPRGTLWSVDRPCVPALPRLPAERRGRSAAIGVRFDHQDRADHADAPHTTPARAGWRTAPAVGPPRNPHGHRRGPAGARRHAGAD